jgi:hypothetical protein
MNAILINDVKKGERILFYQGDEGEILDNLRGITRCVKREVWGQPGSFDCGSIYVDEITSVWRDYKWQPVQPSPAQRKRLVKIRKAGF